ncbi:unnamed protein product [Lampetra planeri]
MNVPSIQLPEAAVATTGGFDPTRRSRGLAHQAALWVTAAAVVVVVAATPLGRRVLPCSSLLAHRARGGGGGGNKNTGGAFVLSVEFARVTRATPREMHLKALASLTSGTL